MQYGKAGAPKHTLSAKEEGVEATYHGLECGSSFTVTVSVSAVISWPAQSS